MATRAKGRGPERAWRRLMDNPDCVADWQAPAGPTVREAPPYLFRRQIEVDLTAARWNLLAWEDPLDSQWAGFFRADVAMVEARVAETMEAAQRLYEGVELGGQTAGLITYMRTDSAVMAKTAVAGARAEVRRRFGNGYVPVKPRAFRSPERKAQEAHEAIRPTDFGRTPEDFEGGAGGAAVRGIDRAAAALYGLVWKRAMASQMAEARFDRLRVEIAPKTVDAPGGPVLEVAGSALAFDGHLRVWDGEAGAVGGPPPALGTRLRLGLEGTWRGVSLGSGTLTPRLEVAVRHDGGDAETGFGLDLGGGVAWSDPARGLSTEASARGLLTHEAGGFRDRSLSGSRAWDPGQGSGRGPMLTLRQTMGASATGGIDALLNRGTLAGLAANGGGDELSRRRLEMKLGYGFSAFVDGFTSTPELGLSDTGRDLSLGWRLGLAKKGPTSLELKLEATRREPANDNAPEHGIGFRVTARW